MRTIKQLSIPKDEAAKFPFGTIINETDTQPGTPVVREIFGDILTNFYAVLRDAGIVANGSEDSDDTSYQFLDALKKFTNDQNDIEQVLTLSVNDFSINLDIDNLPNKYVIFARAADAYVSGETYTFSGTGNDSYSLTSPTGFAASDEVMIVIDQAGVRIYSFSAIVGGTGGEVVTSLGAPLAYNASDKMYYAVDGRLYSDTPSVDDLQSLIRTAAGVGTLYVNEVMVLKGFVFCVTYDTAAETYLFYQFPLTNLASPAAVTVNGVTIPTGVDRAPYVFTDGDSIYVTNSTGRSDNDYEVDRFTYAPGTLTYAATLTLANTFEKTTNTVVTATDIVTFVSGKLSKFSLSTGNETVLGTYNTLIGQIFGFNGSFYHTTGEVARKWIL